ncbi:glycosyltransferase family 4 protein [Paenalcaligenes hominis]|nr:glycosyltransferase family 4 protein [Paenalcaligenes hominis]
MLNQTHDATRSVTASGQGPLLLYVVNNPAFFVSHRLPLAIAAKKAGFTVQVATMDGSAVARIRELGFIHHRLPLSRSGKNPLAELRSIWAIYRLFKRVQPQVVHAVTIKPVLYGGIAARLARVPGFLAAVSGLGYIFTNERGGLMRWLALRLYGLALKHPRSRVIFQNSNDRDVLLNAGAVRSEQAVLIRGSGVDLDTFNYVPEPDGPPVALMVSRLLLDKGIHEFITAAQKSQAAGEAVVWQIAGSPDKGNPASVTAEQMTQWHQSGVIQWLGEQTNIAELYHKSHIAVLPSYREGLPKSLIEAAACGRAVVTTDVPGCRDAIEANVTGLLVPAQDADALYEAILTLAKNKAMRQQFGRAGRDLAERAFDINTVIDTHLRLYGYLAKNN